MEINTNNFYLDFNVTGAERKRLVKAISDFTGADAKYQGAPTFAYMVDYFTIDRYGVVSFDDRADSEEIEGLIDTLANEGFVSQVSNLGREDEEPETDTEIENAEPLALTVRMPLDKVNVTNLTNLVNAKGNLLRKALGVETLPIKVEDETVAFPWFPEMPEAGASKAYSHLIAALCEMSRNQKRVTATEKEVDNEKYAFRCFLLRLGFIGAEYKDERKILLRNLTGSSAFKSGQRKTAAPAPLTMIPTADGGC